MNVIDRSLSTFRVVEIRDEGGSGLCRIWRMLLGVCDRTVLEGVDIDEDAETVVAHAPRVRCREHGRVVAQVGASRCPADGGVRGHCGMAGHAVSKTAVSGLLRVTWRTVDQLAGLKRIGIDEINS